MTVKIIGQHRFFFSSSDGGEPPHVHIEHEGRVAKFWLNPVAMAKSGRFTEHQLRQVERLVTANRLEFLEAWHDFFGR